jgi:hypothetical protein
MFLCVGFRCSTWFQRHEEPVTTTNEYEIGTWSGLHGGVPAVCPRLPAPPWVPPPPPAAAATATARPTASPFAAFARVCTCVCALCLHGCWLVGAPCSHSGMYKFFDYENAWGQRIKRDFQFEYVFLEDDTQ